MMMAVAVVVLCACLLVSLTINFLIIRVMQKEHRDECTRLMCKDVSEYKAMTEETIKTPSESPHQRAIREWREKAEFSRSENLHGRNPQSGFFRGKR